MATPPIRFSQLRWLHNLACVLGIVGGCALVTLGLVGVESSPSGWLMVAGGFGLLLAAVFMTIMPLLVKMEATVARQLSEFRELKNEIARQSADLQVIARNTGFSDAAKSLTHRDQELETLRAAIRADIENQKWESAFGLIEAMENRFGAKEEADALREELDNARGDAIQARLAEAIKMIEVHFAAHDWARARVEIDRLAAALPGNTKVAALVDREKMLKEKHKEEMKAAWQEAVRRSDTDLAIDILRELDQYLSPAEAHTLQSSARHVFKEKLLQLGVQFRFAVTEKRWNDAINTGLELVRDFPNARMANEVREALDTLRERARQRSEMAEA